STVRCLGAQTRKCTPPAGTSSAPTGHRRAAASSGPRAQLGSPAGLWVRSDCATMPPIVVTDSAARGPAAGTAWPGRRALVPQDPGKSGAGTAHQGPVPSDPAGSQSDRRIALVPSHRLRLHGAEDQPGVRIVVDRYRFSTISEP